MWTTIGEYKVDLELEDTVITGISRLNYRFSITNIEEELVAIYIDSSDQNELIALRARESFSDLGQTNEIGEPVSKIFASVRLTACFQPMSATNKIELKNNYIFLKIPFL